MVNLLVEFPLSANCRFHSDGAHKCLLVYTSVFGLMLLFLMTNTFKFFGQRTRQLLEIWYKLLNHFVKGYSVNTEIFAPVFFCFFRPRHQQANLGLGEFHCLKISLFHHNFVWVNLKRGETLCK